MLVADKMCIKCRYPQERISEGKSVAYTTLKGVSLVNERCDITDIDSQASIEDMLTMYMCLDMYMYI